LYCWGGRRSGALEHVSEKYGWTHSSQLHRINSKLISDKEWLWLKQIFVVVHRMFDEKETGDTASKIHWLNIVDCRLVYNLLKRECYHYHRHLYPAGSVLGTYLKQHGVEVETWYYSVIEPEEQVSAANITSEPSTSITESPDSPVNCAPHEADDSSLSLPSSGSSYSAIASADIHMDGSVPLPCGALGSYEWLSDVHIANLMFLLLHGQLMLPMEHRDLFQCVYPMTDDLFIQMLQRSESGSLLMHAKSGAGVTLVFINPHNNHWRLLILDGLQQHHSLRALTMNLILIVAASG
jgi:hypothetical protein